MGLVDNALFEGTVSLDYITSTIESINQLEIPSY